MTKVIKIMVYLLVVIFAMSNSLSFTYLVGHSTVVKANVTGQESSSTPIIKSLSTNIASIEGGQQIIITGENFTSDTKLVLGGTIIKDFTVKASKIKFRVPAQKLSGAQILSVINKNGIAQSQFNIVSKAFSDLKAGEITTFLGGTIYFGDGLLASSDRVLISPSDMAVDKQGNIFFSDAMSNEIRRIDTTTSIITAIAGNGQSGFSGDGDLALAATLSSPSKIILDNDGNLFFIDGSQYIRKIDNNNIITTIAGNGLNGFPDNNVPATKTSVYPMGLAIDSGGNLYFTDVQLNAIRKINASTKIVSTIAGNGQQGFNGDNKLALQTNFNIPLEIAIDKDDNILVADSFNHRIRKINSKTRIVTTIAGTTEGFSGDEGSASFAMLDSPRDLVLAQDGSLFITDVGNNRIRKVDTKGIITTVAGNGDIAFNGDGGLATNASFKQVSTIAIDKNGNLLIGDATSRRIRKVDQQTNIISTLFGIDQLKFINNGDSLSSASLLFPRGLAADNNNNIYFSDGSNRVGKVRIGSNTISVIAGTGVTGFGGDGDLATKAALAFPLGMTVDSKNQLFIADEFNNRIRKVDILSGIITTVAGSGFIGFSDNLPATNSNLTFPSGVAVDNNENLFIADTFNSRIRKVDFATQVISTIAGNGVPTFSGDGDKANLASISRPNSLVIDSNGNVVFSDTFNNRVRKIDINTGIITTIAGSGVPSTDVGDGNLAVTATLISPLGLCLDGNGDIYIADSGNNRIRKIDIKTGIISTVVGDGKKGFAGDGGVASNANLSLPSQIAIDNDGNLLFTDVGNNRIRVVKAIAVGKQPKPILPTITNITFSDPTLNITGTGFGANGATVIINKMDLTSRIGKQTDSLIVLVGDKTKLNLRKGKNKVIVKTSLGVSNTFVFSF